MYSLEVLILRVDCVEYSAVKLGHCVCRNVSLEVKGGLSDFSFVHVLSCQVKMAQVKDRTISAAFRPFR